MSSTKQVSSAVRSTIASALDTSQPTVDASPRPDRPLTTLSLVVSPFCPRIGPDSPVGLHDFAIPVHQLVTEDLLR